MYRYFKYICFNEKPFSREAGLTVVRMINKETLKVLSVYSPLNVIAIVGQTVFERQVMPGWNAPQEVEIVHTLCAGKQ